MGNTVIVALPSLDDKVYKISSEKVPHMTLISLGDLSNEVEQLVSVVEFIEHACQFLTPFGLTVDHRGELGPNRADVLFFEEAYGQLKQIRQFRSDLLGNEAINRGFHTSDQFPEWTPHLTLGYPEAPARPDNSEYPGIHHISFDRVAVWMGDYQGPEFRLKYRDAQVDMAHFGVKGMKWGVRKEDTSAPNGTPVLTQECKNGTSLTVYETKSPWANNPGGELYHTFEFRDKEGKKVGEASFYKEKKDSTTLELEWIGVDKHHRSNGYARAALNGVIEHSKANGITRLQMHATKMGQPLYESLGFERAPGKAGKDKRFGLPRYQMDIPALVAHAGSVESLAEYIVKAIDNDPELNETEEGEAFKMSDLTSAASTTAGREAVADILAHYGVKGMKWGVTKKDRASERTPTDVQVVQKKPGEFAKATGGKNLPISPDAKAALEGRQKAKASTTDALSNAELRKVVERMNLEQQYNKLQFESDRRSRGMRFVAGFFGAKRYNGEKRKFSDRNEDFGEMTRGTAAGVGNVIREAARRSA